MAYKPKTTKNKKSVAEYIDSIAHPQRKKDAKAVHKLMKEVSGEKGSMWGSSIVGYGSYHYKSKSGIEADWMMIGWSSRVQNLTIYIMPGYQLDDMKKLLAKLGPHKTGKSCLYIKRLDDIDMPTLQAIIKKGLTYMQKNYGTS